jgi:CSLREA domain-containing protein
VKRSTWLLIALTALFSNQLWPIARAATTFTVNSLADTGDAVPGNGLCADAGGLCTLRAALQEANALAGDEIINFSVTGTINLTGALPDITETQIAVVSGSRHRKQGSQKGTKLLTEKSFCAF